MGRIVLVGGGVRSGKSAFALARARKRSEPRVFLATAETLDGEMRERVDRHRSERGAAFETIEEPQDLLSALERAAHANVVVIDCLTLWLSNRMLAGDPGDEIVSALDGVLSYARSASHETILVTNEVGMGIVPESALGRRFRDLAGTAHQAVAGRADEVYLAALGMVLRLHPGPVERAEP